MFTERIASANIDHLGAQIGNEGIDQFISWLSEQELPFMIGGGGFVGGLLVMNEYVGSKKSEGESVGRVKRITAFSVGFVGGSLAATPFALLVHEALSGDL